MRLALRVVMSIDDEGELAQEMRAAQRVVAMRVAEVRGPAVVDRDAAVAREDADGLDGLASALGVEAFDGERSGGVDMNPVILSVHAQRGLVDVHRRCEEQPFNGVVLPLGQRLMELSDVAEQRRLGQELADEGVHRLGDALEREHLGDEQVHGIGLDAGAVLERAGHRVGEARPGLGVAARAVLDVGVGVTHDLLEHDVDKCAPLMAGGCGVGEVFAAACAGIDAQLGEVGPGARVCSARLVRCGSFALGAGARAGGVLAAA